MIPVYTTIIKQTQFTTILAYILKKKRLAECKVFETEKDQEKILCICSTNKQFGLPKKIFEKLNIKSKPGGINRSLTVHTNKNLTIEKVNEFRLKEKNNRKKYLFIPSEIRAIKDNKESVLFELQPLNESETNKPRFFRLKSGIYRIVLDKIIEDKGIELAQLLTEEIKEIIQEEKSMELENAKVSNM